MAPIITLYVGEDRIEYHVHEDTLCKLPFFRAALLGQFKEATEKAITMPEDDPEAVSALIKWLYNAELSNVKTLHHTTMKLRQVGVGSSLSPLFLEGLFYLEVSIVASKYECEGLLQAAIKGFYGAQRGLSDIAIFRLFKCAYTTDERLPVALSRGNQASIVQSTILWIRRVRRDNSEEVEKTLEAFPGLATSILHTITADSSDKIWANSVMHAIMTANW